MNSNQFKRWLVTHGCTVETKKGGGGHLIVRRGSIKVDLPSHGGSKQLGKGLIRRIAKELRIEEIPPG